VALYTVKTSPDIDLAGLAGCKVMP